MKEINKNMAKKIKNKGSEMRVRVEHIRFQYLNGYIGLEEAKEAISPLLDSINASGRRIAKEHGEKFAPLSFSYIFR